LDEQIDRSPNRVQQTGEREVEEPQPEIRRRRRDHEPLNRPIAALNLPAIAILAEESTATVGHEHRVLPVIIVFRVLFASVDQRRLVPLVLVEVELPVSFIPVLVTLEQPLGLSSLAGLHPLRNDIREPALANHLQEVLAIELPVHQDVIDMDEVLSRIEQVLDDFQSCSPIPILFR
jgi:hypothetical protein